MSRLYRALLFLYPASFRAEYGDQMTSIFRAQLRDASGPAGRALLFLATVAEVAANAAAVHWDILRQDVRYTLRTLARARGFALTAIAVIALGIGANTAAFSVTDFVLLRPLPFDDADRLVTIWQRTPGYSRLEMSPPNYRDWKAAAKSFDGVGVHRQLGATLLGAGEPERITGSSVSADLFSTLGVHAALGRAFRDGDDEETAPRTVVLSDALWRAAFGGDPGVLGRTIVLDDQSHTVIGVMPRGFSFPDRDVELWVPLVFNPNDYQDRSNNELYAIARLKPNVTVEQAWTEMNLIADQTRRQYPKENESTSAAVYALRDDLSRQSRVLVLALSGAAVCVLLIACANLANLLLTRALARRQELAVRTAMGAGRERLVRQLATESVLLAAAGGGLGVLLAWATVPLLWSLVPATLPTADAPSVDARVLAFAAALTLVTSLAFGLAPMLRTSAQTDMRGLRDGARALGGRKERLRGALVVSEVVAAVVLLITTGLLVRALWTIQGRDPGFRVDGVLTLRTDMGAKYVPTERRAQYYDRILTDVRALPGVSNAAYISGLPMVWRGGIWPVGINGVELERRTNNTASMRFVTPGFFETLGIPLRRGRDVSNSDTAASQHVAVVSESLVKRYWPNQDGLGRRFHFATVERIIVGVVADVRVRGLERDSEPQVYLPHRQVKDGWFWGYTPKDLVISASTPVEHLVPAVREAIRRADPQQPITQVRPMRDIIARETSSRAVQVRVLAGFASIALLLAATGIHGVLAFAVSQRTPEIGVRIALGAQRSDILRMVARHGVTLVAIGLIPGLVLAYFAGRSLQTVLVGITPLDPQTFGATAVLTLIMTAAGILLPTLRALRVDPITAIRME